MQEVEITMTFETPLKATMKVALEIDLEITDMEVGFTVAGEVREMQGDPCFATGTQRHSVRLTALTTFPWTCAPT